MCATMTEAQKKRCIKVTEKILSLPIALSFSRAVDPIQDGAPDYFDKIKKPMDLSLVLKKLHEDQYSGVDKWKEDMNLIWKNATTYNDINRPLHAVARELKDYFARRFENVMKSEVELWTMRVRRKHETLQKLLEAKPDPNQKKPKPVSNEQKPKPIRSTKIMLRQKSLTTFEVNKD